VIRAAVIGASHWHLDLFLPTLLDLDDVQLVGVSDPDGDRARSLGEQLGCAWSDSYTELCDQQRPDFVLALGTHADMFHEARYLIDRGIAFAIEKPCGLDARQVHALARQAADRRAFAAVPFVWRQSELLEVMRSRFADEDVSHMSLRWIAGAPSRYVESGCGWMLDPAQAGGGCTINLSVHLLDLARVVLGPDLRVETAVMSHSSYGLPVEDWSAVALRSARGVALVETGYLLPARHSQFDMRFSIKARHHYVIATGPEDVEVVGPHGEREHVRAHTTNVPHYPVFVRDVLRRFSSGEPPLASLSDMAAVMDLVQRAYHLDAGRPVPDRPDAVPALTQPSTEGAR
jgi:predicted dehydrogenase